MAKKVEKLVKLQIPAGKATPAPPVGPALGQAGINIMGFTKEFNARTADQAGMIIPVVISVYEDKSFTFVTKTPPAAVLLKKAAQWLLDHAADYGFVVRYLKGKEKETGYMAEEWHLRFCNCLDLRTSN